MKSAVVAAALATCGLFVSNAHAAEVAYWNFNDATTAATAADIAAAFAADGGQNVGSATMTTTFTSAAVTIFGGTLTNAVGTDTAGNALALQGGTAVGGVFPNNGASLTFGASTSGFTGITVSLAMQRTATGFNADQFAYSLDGVNFTNLGTSFAPVSAFSPSPAGLQTFDLSTISGLNNNLNAKFRITFDGATAAAGNNRLDNVRISGASTAVVPEAGTLALIAPALGVLGAVVVRRRKTA